MTEPTRTYAFAMRKKRLHCTAMTLFIALGIFSTASPARADEDCTKSTSKIVVERPASCLQPPGWFDIGAGFAVMPNAGAAQQTVSGALVTLRAYPFGRWYAALKAPSPARNAAITANLDAVQEAANAADANRKAAVTALASALAAAEKAQPVLKKARENDPKVPELTTNIASIQAAIPATLREMAKAAGDLQTVAISLDHNVPEYNNLLTAAIDAKLAADTAAASQEMATGLGSGAASGMQAALNDFGDSYSVQDDTSGMHLLKRASVFYGRSVGGFDSKLIDGDINAFGLAYDIAPMFSLIWGRAWYNVVGQPGVTDTSKSEIIFGVQLNLNAFKAMRGLTGSM